MSNTTNTTNVMYTLVDEERNGGGLGPTLINETAIEENFAFCRMTNNFFHVEDSWFDEAEFR